MTKTNETPKDYTIRWNKFAYTAFVLLAIYYVFFKQDISSAVANFGIALAFDPFNMQMKWGQRPVWQRAWLIIHLIILLVGFIFMFLEK
jgi:hypothetical protein